MLLVLVDLYVHVMFNNNMMVYNRYTLHSIIYITPYFAKCRVLKAVIFFSNFFAAGDCIKLHNNDSLKLDPLS